MQRSSSSYDRRWAVVARQADPRFRLSMLLTEPLPHGGPVRARRGLSVGRPMAAGMTDKATPARSPARSWLASASYPASATTTATSARAQAASSSGPKCGWSEPAPVVARAGRDQVARAGPLRFASGLKRRIEPTTRVAVDRVTFCQSRPCEFEPPQLEKRPGNRPLPKP